MSSTPVSFKEIFNLTVIPDESQEDNSADKVVKLQKISIPIIQRDYAQGRASNDIKRVRDRFLDSLYNAVNGKPITLDFIYGDIDDAGTMTPLDGQQRLTTLFLLYWYAAKKDSISEEEIIFLKHFTYETRYSARDFCQELISHCPSFTTSVSAEIINQTWFPLDWKNDPTINSMLRMLDAIDEKFKAVDNLWDRLEDKAITFYFLPIKDMGLTDDLYIKMNSRGKPLTTFEHFKAELEHELRSLDRDLTSRIIEKIDGIWTDFLWQFRKSGDGSLSNALIDNMFLRYFKFICDIICYEADSSPLGRGYDEHNLIQLYFSKSCSNALENAKTMESFFDAWCTIENYDGPEEFLTSFMEPNDKNTMKNCHVKGKILYDKSLHCQNIFEECLYTYTNMSGNSRTFSLVKTCLLYAITIYLLIKGTVTEEAFSRRIRTINNLLQNSEDELAERIDRNRMPAIIEQVSAIMRTGKIDDSITNSFNKAQLEEEKEKLIFAEENHELAETLFELEDHALLNGQIGIIGLDNLSLTRRFESLFLCDLDKIDCALMTKGDYGQKENYQRFQYGSRFNKNAWQNLFHKSSNIGFGKTRETLHELLGSSEEFTNDTLTNMIDSYLLSCEKNSRFPFRYYYIKYKEFRPGSFGKLNNRSAEENPYLFSVMLTKSKPSENSYLPYLKIAACNNLSRNHLGERLIFGEDYIICKNNSYERRCVSDGAIIETISIPQDEYGIDVEDRVLLLKDYITKNFKLN